LFILQDHTFKASYSTNTKGIAHSSLQLVIQTRISYSLCSIVKLSKKAMVTYSLIFSFKILL
jgi:hypothetical protein